MAEQVAAGTIDLYRVARIVGSYARHHHIEPSQLVHLIGEVHRALNSLGQSAPSVAEPRRPAVPIRQSVRPEYVVCLECGFRSRVLRRHLRVQHGFRVADYRARWNLRSNHPVTAPAYSQRRSAMAKQLGLGRRPVQVATHAVATAASPAANQHVVRMGLRWPHPGNLRRRQESEVRRASGREVAER